MQRKNDWKQKKIIKGVGNGSRFPGFCRQVGRGRDYEETSQVPQGSNHGSKTARVLEELGKSSQWDFLGCPVQGRSWTH